MATMINILFKNLLMYIRTINSNINPRASEKDHIIWKWNQYPSEKNISSCIVKIITGASKLMSESVRGGDLGGAVLWRPHRKHNKL